MFNLKLLQNRIMENAVLTFLPRNSRSEFFNYFKHIFKNAIMFFYRLLTNITALWFPQQRDVKGNNRPPLIEVFFWKICVFASQKDYKIVYKYVFQIFKILHNPRFPGLTLPTKHPLLRLGCVVGKIGVGNSL